MQNGKPNGVSRHCHKISYNSVYITTERHTTNNSWDRQWPHVNFRQYTYSLDSCAHIHAFAITSLVVYSNVRIRFCHVKIQVRITNMHFSRLRSFTLNCHKISSLHFALESSITQMQTQYCNVLYVFKNHTVLKHYSATPTGRTMLRYKQGTFHQIGCNGNTITRCIMLYMIMYSVKHCVGKF